MKTLIVLLASFGISLIVCRLIRGNFDIAFSARIGMSCMLVFAAIGHFVYTKGMVLMLPEFIPLKTEMVYLTGVLEILFAVALLVPQYQVVSAWLILAFFVLILPSNIYAAIKHVDFTKATFQGSGLTYLWLRVPLQMLFIAWVYLSAIK